MQAKARKMLWRLLFLLSLSFSVIAENHAIFAVDKSLGDGNTAQNSPPGYVFDITVQNERQLDAILDRADQLKGRFSPNEHGRIALVLHGQELRLFQKSNYREYSRIVDRMRLLDQQNLIDVKACQTAMDFFQIDQSELPDFIEQVPLAPVEIDRLEKERGYTRL